MSDFLLRFSWVLFRPVGFCCRRPGFWAGLVLEWVGLGWVGLGWLVLDGLVLGRIAPGMGFWAFVRDILRVWSEVLLPRGPVSGSSDRGSLSGSGDGNARDSGQGTT